MAMANEPVGVIGVGSMRQGMAVSALRAGIPEQACHAVAVRLASLCHTH